MPKKPASPLLIADVMRDVRRVYEDLSRLDLPRTCTALTTCCQFLLTGKTPMLTPGEAMVAAHGVRAAGRKRLPASTDPASGRCPMLGKDGRCTIYAFRPFGCRTHFCAAAGGPYPRKAVREHIHRLESISESLGLPTDPRPLEAAVNDALEQLAALPPKTKKRHSRKMR